jgi:hypothetical protein
MLNHFVDAAHIKTSEKTPNTWQLRATSSSFSMKKLKNCRSGIGLFKG